jgi:hypothetical protein
MSKVDALHVSIGRFRSLRLRKVETGGTERDPIMPSPSGSRWRG